MDTRLNYYDNAMAEKVTRPVASAGRIVMESPLPHATQALVEIRASQINGCAVCIDMHTKEAEQAGETPLRLHLVATWREATTSPVSGRRTRRPSLER